MTPGELGKRGAGLGLAWGIHDSPFGLALVFTTARGVAGLAFADPGDEAVALADMRRRWPGAVLRKAPGETRWVADMVAAAGGRVPLHLAGTNLQLKVWEALLAIPAGRTASYGAVARAIGHPKAARAVGAAVGANPVAWLIPCHRVLRESGALGGYHWGLPRKEAMLAFEHARAG